jgi:hypothetical protein
MIFFQKQQVLEQPLPCGLRKTERASIATGRQVYEINGVIRSE